MSGVAAVGVQVGADWPFRCEWQDSPGHRCPEPATTAAVIAMTSSIYRANDTLTCDWHRDYMPVGHTDTAGWRGPEEPDNTWTITGYRPLNEGDLPDPEEGP